MSASPSGRSRSREPARYSPSRGGSYSRSASRGRSYTPDRGDDQVTTVYVGGISFDTDERALQNYFQKFGNVLETKVVIDRETQRSKGYGFVKFEDPRDAKDAISGCNGKLLDGRTIRCNMAKYNPGNGPPPAPRGGYTDGYGGPRGGPPDFSGGRGYGGRGYGGRGGYDDGYGYGGRGRGGGRFENGGGRGGGRFGYNGRGGGPPPQGPYPPEVQERGPPAKRQRSISGSPPREGRHKHRRSSRRHKTYSSSPSGSSYSRSASRSESRSPKHHKRRAAAHADAGADQATVAELATAKVRVAELETRIAALESQASVQNRARSDMTDQLADLNVAQQKAEATHKLYRRWMSALLESAQELLASKDQVKAAEDQLADRQRDLANMVTEADSFLQQERRSRKVARRPDTSVEPSVAEGAAKHEVLPVAANGVAPSPADDAPGGWQEAGTPMATEEPPVQAGARLAGTKFTIET